jgi:hypothetical protein
MLDNSTNKNIGLVDRGLKLGANTVLNTIPVSSFENGIALAGASNGVGMVTIGL